jgi:acetylornithine deacetylase
MPLDLVQTLSDLVALPSVNPMGRPADGPEFLEHRVTDYLEQVFRRLGVPWHRQTVAPRRDNIVAFLAGDSPAAPLLLFEAHQDTVPVTGMTIDPWRPVVDRGRLFGRGACDVKGGLAAMLCAFARLVAAPPPGRPALALACTVNEEHGFSGAKALVELWSQPGSIFPAPPAAAVVAEPTALEVVVAHKGVVRWRCHALGRAAHSSQPALGDNAIFRLAPALAALQHYALHLVPTLAEHPRCGRPTLSVGTIVGGLSVNTVPDRATIEIDRRLVPGEDAEPAYRQTIDYLAQACGPDWPLVHDPPFLVSRPLADEHNLDLAHRLLAQARSAGAASAVVGVPYGTNAAVTAAAGVPSVVFGPGSIDQAHTADEWIDLDQLHQASEILLRFASQG